MVLSQEATLGRQTVVYGDCDCQNFASDLRAVQVGVGIGGAEEDPTTMVEVDDDGKASYGVVVGG